MNRYSIKSFSCQMLSNQRDIKHNYYCQGLYIMILELNQKELEIVRIV
jgi:hypothetical protein